MKNCPFCNQPLEDEVTKCLFCDKPLVVTAVAASAKEKTKWYHSTGSLIVGFFVVGPLILPAVWSNPKFDKNAKIIITVVCLLATYYVTAAVLKSFSGISKYYNVEEQILNGTF